jgi:pantoate--beta-alanine ligase
MEIINRKPRMSSIARKLRRENKTVGFVPTMGALHEGHLALVKEARKTCDIVIVSIFVNPTQFGKGEDFKEYPRDLMADAALLAESQVDYVFAPDAEEIYVEGFCTYVEVEGITEKFEGELRPGHFRGVATIVTILLNTIRPDFAYFGQKDAQQTAVVKRLVRDLGIETEIVVVRTVREESGLAMSSRNLFLSDSERADANVIFEGLKQARIAFAGGERNASKLAQIVRNEIAKEPSAQIDYVAAVDAESFVSLDTVRDEPTFLIVAVRFGAVRLLDNILLNRKQ